MTGHRALANFFSFHTQRETVPRGGRFMSGMYERSIEQAQNHLRHEQLFKGTMKGRVMTILATSIVLGLSSQRAG